MQHWLESAVRIQGALLLSHYLTVFTKGLEVKFDMEIHRRGNWTNRIICHQEM